MSGAAGPERLCGALAGLELHWLAANDGVPTLEVAREHAHDVLARLRDAAGFAQNTLVTAVDHHPATPRFELVWMLYSHQHNERVRVKCRVGDGREEDAWVPSVVDLWPGANFSERECFDLFGVRFEGHPDLRRLMMPEGYEHHPLRKDFPHHGVEPDRLYRAWDRARRDKWEAEERARAEGAGT